MRVTYDTSRAQAHATGRVTASYTPDVIVTTRRTRSAHRRVRRVGTAGIDEKVIRETGISTELGPVYTVTRHH